MKNLEIRNLGVCELNSEETKTTDGGSLVAAFIAFVALSMVTEIASNPRSSLRSFKAGWDSVD